MQQLGYYPPGVMPMFYLLLSCEVLGSGIRVVLHACCCRARIAHATFPTCAPQDKYTQKALRSEIHLQIDTGVELSK
jgi:hypothetical protein